MPHVSITALVPLSHKELFHAMVMAHAPWRRTRPSANVLLASWAKAARSLVQKLMACLVVEKVNATWRMVWQNASVSQDSEA